MTDTPQVEQRHREAAADYLRKSRIGTNETYRRYLEGIYDESNIVQAFARFEAAHLATLTAERDAARELLKDVYENRDEALLDSVWLFEVSTALADAPGTQEG
jgi:hypothetical protein